MRGFADQRLRKADSPLDPANRRISIIVQYIVKDEADSKAGSGDEGKGAEARGANKADENKTGENKPTEKRPEEKPSPATVAPAKKE